MRLEYEPTACMSVMVSIVPFIPRHESGKEPGNGFYLKRLSIEKYSGNQVHHMNSLILLLKIMLCSKLYCKKTFRLNVFSCEMQRTERSVSGAGAQL
jgi:hypothetical protein